MTHTIFSKLVLSSLLVGTLSWTASMAEARLAGEAEWAFTTYDADINSKKSSGSTFKHQYSLLYGKNGLLERGNLGKYQFDIGYEWAQFITKVSGPGSDDSISQSAGHLLYSGQIDLKPSRFPIRFKAYSRDLSRIGFNDTGPFLNTGDDMFDSRITGSLTAGTHIRNGATLVVGLTKDAAVPIFRDYPKLDIDYRQNYDRDTKDIAPIDTQSDILTMTLTKGDVGFYYLRSEFKDKIIKQTTVDTEYTIGTIGERGSRKWVDLTNWIRLSADATFFERKDSVSGEATNEYDVNVYAMASRQKWDLVTLNNFNRISSPSGGITERLTVPVFVKGIWDADTDWQLRFTATDYTTQPAAGSSVANSGRSDILGTLQINALKRSVFTVSPFLSVERLETDKETTSIFTGRVETNSTRRFSDRYALFGSYEGSLTTSDTVADSKHYEFIRNTVTGRIVYRVSDKLRVEAEERVTVGSGTTTTENAYRNGISTGTIAQAGSGTAFQRDEATSSYYQSVSRVRAAWEPAPRLRFGLELTGDVVHTQNADTDTLATAVASVQYDLPAFSVGSSTRLAKRNVGTLDATEISGTTHARYTPDPKMSAEFNCNYSFQDDSDSSFSNVELVQRFRYSFFRGTRRLLDARQELSWIRQSSSSSSSLSSLAAINSSQKRLTVGADYYLTRNWVAYAAIRYSLLDPGSEKELMGNGGLSVTYGKLQGNIEYGYGRRNGKDDNRIEKRFSANLRKQF